MLKTLKNGIIYLTFICIVTILMLELSYRYYIIDFYAGHLAGLNTEKDLLADDQSTLLIIGDSFSADKDSYVNVLRDSLPSFRVINAAIPGTSIRQHAILIENRIKAFKPDILLYQIYVGNDLLEFHHPVQNPAISWVRKAYWWLGDRLLILPFINSRLPQLRQAIYHDLPTGVDSKALAVFLPEKYSSRTKMHFRAEPSFLENTILLKQNRQEDMPAYVEQLNDVLGYAGKDCKVVLLVMPHCIQINEQYALNMVKVGAEVTESERLTEINYPFIEYIAEHLEQPNVLIVNPLEQLQKEEIITPVYYGNDPHLNTRGQRISGACLLEKMRGGYLQNNKKASK